MKTSLKLLSLITLLALTASASSCGALSNGSGTDKKKAQTTSPTANTPSAIEMSTTAYQIPVETFALEGEMPRRLRASSLTLHFRSNIPGSTFECLVNSEGLFGPCDDDSFTFEQLIHGRAYTLAVRARAPDGRIDSTPVETTFLVDNISGETLGEAIDLQEKEPVDADDLPQAITDSETGPTGNVPEEDRSLQIGSFYALAVPYNMSVTSYSTTKTYNNQLRSFRLMNAGHMSGYSTSRCEMNWERVVFGSDQSQYCEATPTLEENLNYRMPLPYNHVEVVNSPETGTDEKLLVAAFDDQVDPLEERLGIENTCRNAWQKGTAAIPLLNSFFGVEPERKLFHWCQVRSMDGRFWWIGYFGGALDQVENAPRMKMIYSISSTRRISSGQAFAARAGRFLPQVIVPLAPVSNQIEEQ